MKSRKGSARKPVWQVCSGVKPATVSVLKLVFLTQARIIAAFLFLPISDTTMFEFVRPVDAIPAQDNRQARLTTTTFKTPCAKCARHIKSRRGPVGGKRLYQ